MATIQEKLTIALQCQSQNYLPCYSIYAGCTSIVEDCEIPCKQDTDCFYNCCKDQLCSFKAKCDSNYGVDGGVSNGGSSSSNSLDTNIILAIVLPIAFVLIIIFTCIILRSIRIRRRRLMNGITTNENNIFAQNKDINEINQQQLYQQQQQIFSYQNKQDNQQDLSQPRQNGTHNPSPTLNVFFQNNNAQLFQNNGFINKKTIQTQQQPQNSNNQFITYI